MSMAIIIIIIIITNEYYYGGAVAWCVLVESCLHEKSNSAQNKNELNEIIKLREA